MKFQDDNGAMNIGILQEQPFIDMISLNRPLSVPDSVQLQGSAMSSRAFLVLKKTASLSLSHKLTPMGFLTRIAMNDNGVASLRICLLKLHLPQLHNGMVVTSPASSALRMSRNPFRKA